MFIFIVAASALFIAACAAFFSIKGLMVLFAGSALSVAIMASSLELGKLVAASFLHRNWKTSSFFLKTYLTVAVGILMFITSLGIFGFLTNAYQIHKGKVAVYQTDLASLEMQQKGINDELITNQERIVSLQELRKEQEARVNAAGNYKAPREQAYKAIETANQEMQAKETRQVELRTQLSELEIKKAEISKELNTKTDIGSFQFIADAIGTDVDTAVKYFILSLVFVFDPLAVALVLALNQLFELRELKKRTHKDRETKLREEAYFHEKPEVKAPPKVEKEPEVKEEEEIAEVPDLPKKTKKLTFVKNEKPTVTGMTKEEKELYAQQQKETNE
jgi:hypothetical protein